MSNRWVWRCRKGYVLGVDDISDMCDIFIGKIHSLDPFWAPFQGKIKVRTYELEKLKYGWKVKDIIDPRYVGLGDTEKWIIDLLRNDPHKNQTDIRTKSAYKGKEINERQMNDIITKLFDNHLIDIDIGKKRGARYFSLI